MTKPIVNPPDIAVALKYDGKNAPRVTAKGRGDLARQIFELAQTHDVPLEEDPELVRLLASIPLGDQIPQALYVAVAEVIAFAYMLSDKVPEGFDRRDVRG